MIKLNELLRYDLTKSRASQTPMTMLNIEEAVLDKIHDKYFGDGKIAKKLAEKLVFGLKGEMVKESVERFQTILSNPFIFTSILAEDVELENEKELMAFMYIAFNMYQAAIENASDEEKLREAISHAKESVTSKKNTKW